YARAQDMAEFARMLGQEERAVEWDVRAAGRAQTMHEVFWDEEQGFFLDYDYVAQQRNPTPTLAGFYPLWAGWATAEQAERAVRDWLPRFEQPGWLVTSLSAQAGRQWAWPN